MPTFLTTADFNRISDITIPANTPLAEWIEAANGLLSTYALDDTKEGFAASMRLVASGIVEFFYSKSRSDTIVAANSPFKSQRIGSYSYTRMTASDYGTIDVVESLPGYLLYILNRYLKHGAIGVSTGVFKELPPEDGVREYYDGIDTDLDVRYG